MSSTEHTAELTFWDHLDELRNRFLRCLIAWALLTTIAFFFKNQLFSIIFAPTKADFITYQLITNLLNTINLPQLAPQAFSADFINTELAAQFLTHLRIAALAGLICAMPYIILQLYLFISPALYPSEKQYSTRLTIYATLLFLLGALLNYFVIFPFAFRFLSTYQVYSAVHNQIALSSYTDTLVILTIIMGAMFQLPILTYFLAKIGLINASTLKQYRRHAIVAIAIIAAIITPTADIFTLLLVSIPIYTLYELSILIIKNIK